SSHSWIAREACAQAPQGTATRRQVPFAGCGVFERRGLQRIVWPFRVRKSVDSAPVAAISQPSVSRIRSHPLLRYRSTRSSNRFRSVTRGPMALSADADSSDSNQAGRSMSTIISAEHRFECGDAFHEAPRYKTRFPIVGESAHWREVL